jgi:hypothetical protein
VWKAALGSDGAGRRWQEWLAGLPPLRTRTCRRHHDGHPDHDVIGRAAAEVCRAYRLRLVQYLTAAGRRDDPTDLPRQQVRCLQLSPLVRARKLRAVPPPVRGKGEIDDREFFLTTAPGAAGG